MTRQKVPIFRNTFYHINARCINKEWFDIPIEDVWAIMEDYLFFLHKAYNIEILNFVLMSNHFHLIAQAPKANLSEAMNYFMRETSRVIGKKAKRINQTYGARFHRTLIENDLQFRYAYKYVYRNPVRALLSAKVEDYPFSTLPGLLGQKKLIIPIKDDFLLFGKSQIEETLSWLNLDAGREIEEQVRKAVRRSLFHFSPLPSGKKSPLNDSLLY